MHQSEIVHLVAGVKKKGLCCRKRMHGMENFKITDAQQEKLIKSFKNAKHQLLKTNDGIWFNITHR